MSRYEVCVVIGMVLALVASVTLTVWIVRSDMPLWLKIVLLK